MSDEAWPGGEMVNENTERNAERNVERNVERNDERSVERNAERNDDRSALENGNHIDFKNNKGTDAKRGVLPPRYGYYTQKDRRILAGSTGFGYALLKTVALAVVFGLVAGAVIRAMVQTDTSGRETARKETRTVSTESSETGNSPETGSLRSRTGQPHSAGAASGTGKGDVADVAADCMPSVVAITSVSIQEIPTFFGYGSRQYQSASSGSGIIVGENEEELLIATNNHVVSGAETLSVLFIGDENQSSGDESLMAGMAADLNYDGAVNASVKGVDAENDLAVVAVRKSEIPADTMDRIKIAVLGDSDNLVVGEQVVAIGNALGYGQSVTSGWVSALNRSISTSTITASGLIQTDAAINPGNSGGALLDMNGEVVGINSAKYALSSVEGVGYAIPITKALPILKELMTKETRVKVDSSDSAYMGITVADMGFEAAWMYNIPDGAFVAEAIEDGAAWNAGIRQGDIIVQLDGELIEDRDDLSEQLSFYSPGAEVEVVIYRKSSLGLYESHTVYVTLGSRPRAE